MRDLKKVWPQEGVTSRRCDPQEGVTLRRCDLKKVWPQEGVTSRRCDLKVWPQEGVTLKTLGQRAKFDDMTSCCCWWRHPNVKSHHFISQYVWLLHGIFFASTNLLCDCLLTPAFHDSLEPPTCLFHLSSHHMDTYLLRLAGKCRLLFLHDTLKPCMLCQITDLYECSQSTTCSLWRTNGIVDSHLPWQYGECTSESVEGNKWEVVFSIGRGIKHFSLSIWAWSLVSRG